MIEFGQQFINSFKFILFFAGVFDKYERRQPIIYPNNSSMILKEQELLGGHCEGNTNSC